MGTSEETAYLRPGVSLNPGEELAWELTHQAEQNILTYMRENGIRRIAVGAGRRICPACADLILNFDVMPATPLKVPW